MNAYKVKNIIHISPLKFGVIERRRKKRALLNITLMIKSTNSCCLYVVTTIIVMDAQTRLFQSVDSLGGFLKNNTLPHVGEHTDMLLRALGDPPSAAKERDIISHDNSQETLHKRAKHGKRYINLSKLCFKINRKRL